MTADRVIAVCAAVAAVAAVLVALWAGRSAVRSARAAEATVRLATGTLDEARRLREEQMGYSGGDYAINYRAQVLSLAREGWSAVDIRELLYKETGFAQSEVDCGAVEDIVHIAQRVWGSKPADVTNVQQLDKTTRKPTRANDDRKAAHGGA